jgi:hypothetical protein
MLLSRSLRPVLLAAGAILCGCSTGPQWPTPKNTTDIVLQTDRRDVITTVSLGDALHLVLPPPQNPQTQWQIISLNTVSIRQMTDLKPVPDRPGAEEVTFQAIKNTARTLVRFAAIDAKAAASTPTDFFAVAIGIKAQTFNTGAPTKR